MIGGVRLPPPAAVVFVADVARMSAFYCTLFAMDVVQADDAHAVLAIDGLQLTVHALAGADASGPTREDSYLKLCFPVPSIAEARVRAAGLGGEVWPVDREWEATSRVFRACDGRDPEGNVFQVREPL